LKPRIYKHWKKWWFNFGWLEGEPWRLFELQVLGSDYSGDLILLLFRMGKFVVGIGRSDLA
jgi:hypothetical protein